MKNLILTLLLLAKVSIGISQNTIFIVQNDTIATIYYTLNEAVDSAVSGSVIYIPGGNFTLNKVIDKELHLRGAGIYPSATTVTGQTNINVSTAWNELITVGADGSTFEGIIFTSDVYTNSNAGMLENVIFDKCLFSQRFIIDMSNLSQGNIMRHCIFNTANFNLVPIYLYNSIIINGAQSLQNANVKNCIFLAKNNNLWCAPISSGVLHCTNPNYTIFENCIFRQTTNVLLGIGNTYLNNLYGGTTLTSFPIGSSGNMFVNSLDSIFVNYSTSETQFSYIFDYNLQTNSIGKNNGTDGTDVGIFGGTHPFPDGAVPIYPHIQTKNISSSTNGNNLLNIQITVEAQN
ncbi:MAG: hypothetical protein AB8G11_06960 [Saprospiraceae bacterium]